MANATITTTNGENNTIRLLVDSEETNGSVVESTMHYAKPDKKEGLYRDIQTQIPNFPEEECPVKVHDVRGHEKDFTFDTHGFQFEKHPISEETIRALNDADDSYVKKNHYPEVEAYLKSLTGASRVICFNHLVRTKAPAGEVPKLPVRGPAQHVHCDNSPNFIPPRTERLLSPDEYEQMLKGRYQIINVWRPLIEHVEDWPLALADYRSVERDDEIDVTIYVKLKDEEYESPNIHLRYNSAHKWHFWSKQQKDEILCFKCYDSKKDVARYTAHTSFKNPLAVEGATPRKSVEIRALAIYSPNE